MIERSKCKKEQTRINKGSKMIEGDKKNSNDNEKNRKMKERQRNRKNFKKRYNEPKEKGLRK